MSFAGKKRKSSDISETKYYAVRAGKTPGVYTKWEDCQKNTYGFKGAAYKSFTNEQEAKDFVVGKVNRTRSKPTGDKFYAVAVGHHPGVYEDWAEASEQITGVKGPKYKKFPTRAEAEEFIRTGGKSSTVSGTDEEPKSKKAKKGTDSESSTPSDASRIKTIRVYTDGSSRGNGKKGAIAGVGVYFGDNDLRNVSERLAGEAQTNQRAELTAVKRALEIVPKDKHIRIVTDSNYTINCCTVWYKNWQKDDKWTTSNGGKVVNKDLIVAVRALIDEKDEIGSETSFEWVKGHSSSPGNEAADRLAVAGAYLDRS